MSSTLFKHISLLNLFISKYVYEFQMNEMIYFVGCYFLVHHIQVLFTETPCKIIFKCLLKYMVQILYPILMVCALLYLGNYPMGFVAVNLKAMSNIRYWFF